ncbi:hypothetical protein ABW51_07030 [Haemophilus sp. C1]|nr:hypothetical protein ABW51_07030 [Haemophilus sp. C1]
MRTCIAPLLFHLYTPVPNSSHVLLLRIAEKREFGEGIPVSGKTGIYLYITYLISTFIFFKTSFKNK